MKTRNNIDRGSKVSEIIGELDLEIEELAGFISLKMETESLQRAKKILRRKIVNPRRFAVAMEALLIFADNLKQYQGLVESAFLRLKSAEKRNAGRHLFYFYVSISDWQSAEIFRPKRPRSSQDLLFSIWTLLELRKTDEALPIFRKCRARRLTAQCQRNLFDYGMMVEAVACFYAQTGEWEKAGDTWGCGLFASPLAPNAWDGIIKAYAAQCHSGLGFGLKFFGPLKAGAVWNESNKYEVNSQTRETIENIINQHTTHLTKILPKNERWRFGL